MSRPRQFNYMPHDFYPTPPEATRALLSVERFNGPVWEPACGNGAIARELEAAGYTVVATDLIDYGYGLAGVDFLAETAARALTIITNPPYGYGMADAFVRQALGLVLPQGGSVAMLLNMASLAHPRRHRLWTGAPPAAIYVVDELQFARTLTDHRYVWVVWRAGHTGRPTLWWLEAGKFRRRFNLPA